MSIDVTLILKLALEYNAAMVAHAAILIANDANPKQLSKTTKTFTGLTKAYQEDLEVILKRMATKK